jgi:hypothetical protein
MTIFYVLICIVSLALYSSVSLNIHNQRKVANLISPVYYIHSGRWHVAPDQKIGVDAVMQNRLEFDSGQNIMEGALVYKIQKQHVEPDEFVQEESKCIQLLVSWRVDHTKGPHIRVLVVEHDKEFNCDEDKLRQLYQKCWHSLDALINPMGDNWLVDDATILTTVKTMSGGYRWDIFVSEGKEDNIKRPLWIDAER